LVALQRLERFTSLAELQPFGMAKRQETSKSAKIAKPAYKGGWIRYSLGDDKLFKEQNT
jgi:hypothetical protein